MFQNIGLNMNKMLKWWVSLKSPWDEDESSETPNSNEDNIFTKARRKQNNKSPLPDFNFNFNFTSNVIGLIVAGLITLWLASGIYEVKEGEEAIIVRFGKFARKGTAGLNYRMPFPIEYSIIEKVNQSRRIEIGYRSGVASKGNNGVARDVALESTMLTGDENIAYLNCDVMWHIKNLEDYIFNVMLPEDSVKTAAESAIREVIGKTPIASVLSSQKQEIADKVAALTQKILDIYKVGVEVDQVQLLKAEPPAEVIDAYRDVQTSRADKEREINQAQAYNNDILPKARGDAAKLLQEAEGYKQEVIARAEGDASRFDAVLLQYQNAKQVTKDRMYLDAVSDVMQGSNKVITNGGVLPHMAIKNGN
jgi:membrane protease subunit HflK